MSRSSSIILVFALTSLLVQSSCVTAQSLRPDDKLVAAIDKPSELYGYGHDGSWEGYETSYYRYLTADRTTVLLSNRGNFNTDKLWTAVDGLVEKHLSKEP